MTLTGDTMSSVARDAAAGAARRRRERRHRSFWRHELMAVKMATLTACHHSAQKKPAATHAATQTDATGLVNPQISITDFAAPVYNQVNQEQILTACSRAPVFVYVAPAPVTEYIAPVPAVTSDAHIQQLLPVYTTTPVTTDVNLDIIGLVFAIFQHC